ncbi:MAG: SNARE domain-containing protein [Sulfobacillus sp.]
MIGMSRVTGKPETASGHELSGGPLFADDGEPARQSVAIEEELRQALKELQNLRDILSEFHVVLEEQQEYLDAVDVNIDESYEIVDLGNQDLLAAADNQNRRATTVCGSIALLGLAGAVPLGLVVGLPVGLASGIMGMAAGGLTVLSWRRSHLE